MKTIFELKQQKLQEMQDMRIQLNKLNDDIKKLDKELYKICIHDWKVDIDEPFDSICKQKCTICKLYNNYSLLYE